MYLCSARSATVENVNLLLLPSVNSCLLLKRSYESSIMVLVIRFIIGEHTNHQVYHSYRCVKINKLAVGEK
jgi:hypothetical protein